mgnify:CR=1 FL=1
MSTTLLRRSSPQATRALCQDECRRSPRKSRRAPKQETGVRIYKALCSNAGAELKRRGPPNGGVWTDDKNGRWRIRYTCPAFPKRSISWTELGSSKAAGVALQQLWEWAGEFDGLDMPEYITACLLELFK